MSKKQLGFDFGKSRGKGCADTLGSGPTPKPGEQVYCAQFMSRATLRREFTSSKNTYQHAVVSSKSKSGPRAVRGWFSSKAAAYSTAEKLKKTDHQVGAVKVRAVGKRAPTKVKAPPSRPAKPATKTKTRPHAAVTPAIKAKAKRAAARLPTPVSVTELVNQHGDKFEVSELKDPRARVLLTLRVGEAVKVTANGFPRGPMVVEAIERGKSMLTLSLASQRGGKKGRSYLTTYHYPERAKGGKLKEYVPFVLLARSRSSISKIARYNPELEDAKTPKGLRPGAKDWPKAPDKARLQYFRDALYSLAKEKTDHKAEDLRMSLILAVERPLEKSYVCQALKEYGMVPTVRRLKVGDILYSSWGYDQTNVDFYQVVGLTDKSAKIRKVGQRVASRQPGSDKVTAEKGNFLSGPTLTKRIFYEWPVGGRQERITPALNINKRVMAWLWDGKPKHQTSQGYGH